MYATATALARRVICSSRTERVALTGAGATQHAFMGHTGGVSGTYQGDMTVCISLIRISYVYQRHISLVSARISLIKPVSGPC